MQGTLAVFLAPDVTPEEEARDLVKQDRFEGWCRNTDMEFTVVNHLDASQSVVKRASALAPGKQEARNISGSPSAVAASLQRGLGLTLTMASVQAPARDRARYMR